MRVPLEWLAEYCDPGLDVRKLGERLAMTGTEVDRIHHHGVANLNSFVVGRVLEASRHPDADRLTVCRVQIAEGEETQIVCGAPNVAAGQTVAVARPGSVMPDGTKLKQAKLRGQASNGMILAEDELGIGMDHAGTMVLPGDLTPGDPLEGVLPLATDVLELDITPNRPDCLAVYGVAREAHAATGAELAPPPWQDDPGSTDSGAADLGVQISVEAPDLCPRFTARAYDDGKVRVSIDGNLIDADVAIAVQRGTNVTELSHEIQRRVGVGMLLRRQHAPHDEVVELAHAVVLDAVDLRAGHRQPRRELLDGHVRRAVLVQPLDGDPHPNCSRKRVSLSKSSRRSGTRCLSIAMRSMPMPKAKPWMRLGS